MINFNPKRNVGRLDRLSFKLVEIKRIYEMSHSAITCIHIFKNWRQMIFDFKRKNFPTKAIMRNGKIIEVTDEFTATALLRGQFPTKAIMRNGKIIEVTDEFTATAISRGWLDEFDIEDDLIIIKKKGFEGIKLHDWKKGDVIGVFVLEDYSVLDVSGSDILDVGANIGDTAIYFLKRGANRIIGLEPSRENFSTAIKNIKDNALEDRVILLNKAIGDKDGTKLVTEIGLGGVYNITEAKNGREVTFVTLKSLVREFGLKNLVLKVDCEGAEYDAILSTGREVLKQFKEIYIEYHYGYVNLKKKLESCGFSVNVSRPRSMRQPLFANPDIILGYVHAKRLD